MSSSARMVAVALVAVVALAGGAAGQASASGPADRAADSGDAVPGELIVRFRDDTSAAEREDARERADVSLERPLAVEDAQLVEVDRGVPLDVGIAQLEDEAEVLYAEPNYVRRAERSAADPFFGDLWGLENTGQNVRGVSGTPDADVDATEAWDTETGRADVKVAVVDTGVDYTHPDLDDNIWSNPDEIAGNGTDDDANGKVDDVRGWDFVGEPVAGSNVRAEDNDPQDREGHGTHVAGTVGAEGGNGTGVTGVSWDVSIMPLRVLNENGSGSVADVVDGYRYAAGEGADVINASLGGNGQSRTEADFFNTNPNVLFVVAAGNDGTDNDSSPQFPCNQPQENVVCVAASDQSDRLAGFSNYGRTNVDIAAPGKNILSTYPQALTGSGSVPYAYLSGTSMATPHVAGAAALVKSRFPGASVLEVKNRLLASVAVKPFGCKVFTEGRLNVARALSTTSTGPVTQAACDTASPEPAPAPAPASSGASGDSGGGDSNGGDSGGGSDAPAEPSAPAVPTPPAAPAPVSARPVNRCKSLSGRRRTLCLRRERSFRACAKLSKRTKRTVCVRRARAAYVRGARAASR